MQLNQKLVERFQALHLNKYGVNISYDVAESQLKQLADLVRITSPTKEKKNHA